MPLRKVNDKSVDSYKSSCRFIIVVSCQNEFLCSLTGLEKVPGYGGSWPSILVSTVENEVRTQNNDCRYVFFKFLQLDIFSAETMQRFQSVLIFIVYVASVCSYLKWCESHSVRLNICYKVWVWFSLQFMSCFQSCFPRNGQLKYISRVQITITVFWIPIIVNTLRILFPVMPSSFPFFVG